MGFVPIAKKSALRNNSEGAQNEIERNKDGS